MFGRDCQSENLLNLMKSHSNNLNIWNDNSEKQSETNESVMIKQILKENEIEMKEFICDNFNRRTSNLQLAKRILK